MSFLKSAPRWSRCCQYPVDGRGSHSVALAENARAVAKTAVVRIFFMGWFLLILL
jgi:hypothetical protein